MMKGLSVLIPYLQICTYFWLWIQRWYGYWRDYSHTENHFSWRYALRLISACLQEVLSRYSCDLLEAPDVLIDSYTERSTAVRIHKQGDWLQLEFISCVIDCCWHNSCQRRKWRLTNGGAGLAAREITSALCEAIRQSSHIPVSLTAFLLPHSITAKQIIQPQLQQTHLQRTE